MVSAARAQETGGLLAAAARGSEAAFDELVAPLLEPAFKLAVVMLRDPEEARDALQEATFTAWRKLGQARHEDLFKAWFLTIVANRCRSLIRTRWWTTLRMPIDHEMGRDQVASGADLDLRRELGRLPASDRAALFLFFYMDLPLNQVGRVLNVSPKAAKSRVHRAVTKLRLAMQEETP